MANEIGKLEEVTLRELWKHEEYGFSTWLESNLAELGAAIGISLSDPKREVTVGSFSVDLATEDQNGAQVAVENQLNSTDHDHLGKLLTYLINLDAKRASRIKFLIPCGGLANEDEWPAIQAKMIDALSRFSTAIRNSGVR